MTHKSQSHRSHPTGFEGVPTSQLKLLIFSDYIDDLNSKIEIEKRANNKLQNEIYYYKKLS